MSSSFVITEPIITEEDKKEHIKEVLNYTEPAPEPKLLGLDVNYANANKWIGYLPIENVLGKKYNNLELHLVRFSLPQMQQGSTTVSFRGYQKEIPTKIINSETKELTLEYVVDSQWKNYKSLFAWMSGIEGTLNPVVSDVAEPISPEMYLPLRIFLLDQYKNKVIQFCFKNCWIKVFNDMSLEVNNSAEITHSFTMVYDEYTIEEV